MQSVWQGWLRWCHGVMFPRQLAFGVWFLQWIHDREAAKALPGRLAPLPRGSIGHALLQFVQANGLKFVPGYERHDLKHVLLGYGLDAPDEMRMQAFMTGNAGWSIESALALLFVVWTPDVWRELPQHYRAGKLARPLRGWRILEVAGRDLAEARRALGLVAAWRGAGLAAPAGFVASGGDVGLLPPPVLPPPLPLQPPLHLPSGLRMHR